MLWALVIDGRVTQTTDENPAGNWEPNFPWIPCQDGVKEGWVYKDGSFSPYSAPSWETLALSSATLEQLTQLSISQKMIISNRVDTITDSIDLDMAIPEEVYELENRKQQLIDWKKYSILLGRVTSQEGWPESVEWPAQPEVMSIAPQTGSPS